jgi:hypothetical protein
VITDSSKDYFTGKILMIYDGDIPSYEEVNQYCFDNYGFRPNFDYTVEPPNEYRGYINHGTVIVSKKDGCQ